jgi:hypothetical protein
VDLERLLVFSNLSFHRIDNNFEPNISGTGCGGESERLEALRLAFTVLQVPPHMSEGLFKVLAAILWLGNIEFEVLKHRLLIFCIF